MAASRALIIDVTPDQFPAILRLERESASGSIVALTHGQALDEAHARGHWIAAAVDGDELVGWIWFAAELRSGETAGQIFRVAVDPRHQREGVGALLVRHALSVLRDRGATRARAMIGADDPAARAFFERTSFAVEAMSMERDL